MNPVNTLISQNQDDDYFEMSRDTVIPSSISTMTADDAYDELSSDDEN